MSYKINLIYDVNYDKQNQVVFKLTDDNINKLSYDVSGKYFTYQKSVRVPCSLLNTGRGIAPTEITGCVIQLDTSITYTQNLYYFVTGFRQISSSTLEFDIEPDYFHTFLCDTSASKISGCLRYSNYNFGLPMKIETPQAITQDFEMNFEKLIAKDPTTPFTIIGVYESSANRTLLFARHVSKDDLNYNVIEFENYTYLYEELSGNYLNIALQECFVIPYKLATNFVNTSPDICLTTEKTGTKKNVFSCKRDVFSNDFTYVISDNYMTNIIYRVGTLFDNIEISKNLYSDDKIKITLEIVTYNRNFQIFMKCGGQQIDITRGFQINAKLNDNSQYYAQNESTIAIQKISNIISATSGVISGGVQIATGQYLQGTQTIVNGVTGFLSGLAKENDFDKKIYSFTGVNLGYYNMLSDLYGFGIITGQTSNKEYSNRLKYFGGDYMNQKVTFDVQNAAVEDYGTYLQFTIVNFSGNIPTYALNELKQIFTNGIYIKKLV